MDTRKLRELGERDALANKPVEAFYDIPDIDHSEEAREQYERAHYSTCVELDREGYGYCITFPARRVGGNDN